MTAWRPIQAFETRLASAKAAISPCSSGLRFNERRCVDGMATCSRMTQLCARCCTLPQSSGRLRAASIPCGRLYPPRHGKSQSALTPSSASGVHLITTAPSNAPGGRPAMGASYSPS